MVKYDNADVWKKGRRNLQEKRDEISGVARVRLKQPWDMRKSREEKGGGGKLGGGVWGGGIRGRGIKEV